MKNKMKNYFHNLKNAEVFQSQKLLLTLSLKMLLVVILMFMNDNGYLSIFIPVIAIPGILFRKVRENKYYWLSLTIFASTFYLVLDLFGYVPNHKHIFAYLIIAVTIAMFLKDKNNPLLFLQNQSKIIIGLCFLFASIGKFLAPEFLNGSFFEFTNSSDPRFFGFTSLIGNVDVTLLKQNETNLNSLVNTISTTKTYLLNGTEKIHQFGLIISYWTIFIESLIAISFCLPKRFKLSKYRNIFLVVFILTTYPIATVTGFAIILTLMGFIQSLDYESKPTNYSLFYLLVFILLPLNYFPFTRLLELFY
ncbi:hypothetical protein IX49_13225 [Cellulophaga lytica]|uniref:hypothetical protein n=1 Tax=Cellulophaga lytica TaxID=979 RepID=UPI0004F5B9DB|nr:hypothetical protein [Cellulophaga lytica]AIM61434.1 hypothetical protein IX49_13225 [Cellulophaga lytica]